MSYIKYKALQALALALAGVVVVGYVYTLGLKSQVTVKQGEVVRLGRAIDVLSGREVKGNCP